MNLCFKPTDNALLFTTNDADFTILGYSIRNGRLVIPAKKVQQLVELPKTRKFIVRLISSISYYSNFSNSFSELLARIRDELKTNQSRFKMTPKLERHIYALLHLIRHNNGLQLLSPEQWKAAKLVIFSDASGRSAGSVLCGIFDSGIVVPLFAQSKILPKWLRQTGCVNQAELWAANLALQTTSNVCAGRRICLFSDSLYVVRAIMTLDLDSLPARARGIALEIRANYDVSAIHLSAEFNFTADLLSRFYIPAQTKVNSRNDYRKLFRLNMSKMTLSKEQMISFMQEYNDAMSTTMRRADDQHMREFRENCPMVYELDKLSPCAKSGDRCLTCDADNLTGMFAERRKRMRSNSEISLLSHPDIPDSEFEREIGIVYHEEKEILLHDKFQTRAAHRNNRYNDPDTDSTTENDDIPVVKNKRRTKIPLAESLAITPAYPSTNITVAPAEIQQVAKWNEEMERYEDSLNATSNPQTNGTDKPTIDEILKEKSKTGRPVCGKCTGFHLSEFCTRAKKCAICDMGSHTTEGHHRFTSSKERKNVQSGTRESKISEYGTSGTNATNATNGLAGILGRLNDKPTRHKKIHEGQNEKPIENEPKQTIRPIDNSDLSLLNFDFDNLNLKNHKGVVKTVHKVTEEIINKARQTCSNEIADRVAKAKYVIMENAPTEAKPDRPESELAFSASPLFSDDDDQYNRPAQPDPADTLDQPNPNPPHPAEQPDPDPPDPPDPPDDDFGDSFPSELLTPPLGGYPDSNTEAKRPTSSLSCRNESNALDPSSLSEDEKKTVPGNLGNKRVDKRTHVKGSSTDSDEKKTVTKKGRTSLGTNEHAAAQPQAQNAQSRDSTTEQPDEEEHMQIDAQPQAQRNLRSTIKRQQTLEAREKNKFDEFHSSVIFLENDVDSSATNDILHLQDRIEIIPNREYEPLDQLHTIINSIEPFNEDDVEIDGDELFISGEENEHGEAPPLSITSNRIKRNDDEILALETDCDKNIIEVIKNAQKNCKETKEAIEIVKNKLQPTREEYKTKSDYQRSLMENLATLKVRNKYLYKEHTDI